MFDRTAALLLLTFLAKAESASNKSWKNLGHTIRESSYTAAMRDGRCLTGRIESFNDNVLIIGSSKLGRKDVVRVGDGTSIADHDPIYSGRSSWSDLQHSEPNRLERIQLHLKNGATRKCRNFRAPGGGEEATCDGLRIGKSEVSRGYYIRLAPATEWEHYVAREDVLFLAARAWFGYALFPRIKVLLYDATLPEESVKVVCSVP